MTGLHHVTAIAGKARRNLDFYTDILGLRLVKKTVNFDDPGTYHFYYGDERGRPGTILTFFPWENAAPGRGGVGQVHQTSFVVPQDSLGYWAHRFIEKGVAHEPLEKKFDETVLPFSDPDGTRVSLVGASSAGSKTGDNSSIVPSEFAIRSLYGVTLLLDDSLRTAAMLTDVFGFKEIARDGSIVRYQTNSEGVGAVVDIHVAKGFFPGSLGRGSVHHIAFRATDDLAQSAMATKLVKDHGLHPTEQKDRTYFRSVYFREPGGILFEIATDAPGFDVDEPVEKLGRALKLPAFLDPYRKDIESALPRLDADA